MVPFSTTKVGIESAKSDSNLSSTITILTAVPTVWSRLVQTFKSLDKEDQSIARTAAAVDNLRLAMSGSSALPESVAHGWSEVSSGNKLLERYGMTEVGMALSCGLDFSDRVAASIGWPLPGVEARLFDTDRNRIIPNEEEDVEGEVQLRGGNIFQEYWGKEDATRETFTSQGNDEKWFKTGDIAVRKVVHGAGETGSDWAHGPMYFMRGRNSVDIIKTGGEKVSALEIESVMSEL
jgi:acyl-CoA synthetase (AMP-forming)/AMP-acid ligase II